MPVLPKSPALGATILEAPPGAPDGAAAREDATETIFEPPPDEVPAAPPAPSPAAPAAEPEVRSLGAYRVDRVLGRGGMGVVYAGHDPALDRKVAIKVLAPELAADRTFVERFLAEARAVAKLSHPNVVAIYATGSEGARHYFAMEFVEGESLEARVAREGPLSPREAVRAIRQAAEGLAAAAAKGIVHRDVKPANLLVAPDGTVKVTDFGLAKTEAADAGLTRAGTVMGSPHYISPEAGRGEEATILSDVYALGGTLHYLLTARVPYEAPTPMAVILRHIQEPPPQVPLAPHSLQALLNRMMAKNPAERPKDYPALLAHLDMVLSGGTLPDRPLVPTPSPGRTAVAPAAGTAALAGTGGSAGAPAPPARAPRAAWETIAHPPEPRSTSALVPVLLVLLVVVGGGIWLLASWRKASPGTTLPAPPKGTAPPAETPAPLRTLKRLLDDLAGGSLPARVEAAEELVRRRDPIAAPHLVAALAIEDGRLASAAAEALFALGPHAVEPLLAAARSGDARLRGRAAAVIGQIAGENFWFSEGAAPEKREEALRKMEAWWRANAERLYGDWERAKGAAEPKR